MTTRYPTAHIAAAAVKELRTGLVIHLPKPARHHSVLHAMHALTGKVMLTGDHVQGFLTKSGEFVNRTEAAKLVGKKGLLYSEDLW